jgi:hypothetical protein
MSDEHDQQSELPLLLKIPRVSFHLSCSDRHTYELIDMGLLELVKLGPKASRITSASVLKLAAQRAKPADQVPGLKQYTQAKKNRGHKKPADGGKQLAARSA